MFILGETTNSIWPSVWSAIAASLSAITAILSGFISYKSYKHQKTKDIINLKPNLFLKREVFSIHKFVNKYFNYIEISSSIRDVYPFKFIEFQNLSNEPIVDLTIVAKYKSKYSEAQIEQLDTSNASLKCTINDEFYRLKVFTQNNEKETTKIGLIDGRGIFNVSLPDNVILDLWKTANIYDVSNIDNFLLDIEFDVKYSHSYSNKPVHFNKNIIIHVSGYTQNTTEIKLEYDTYVFPKL
ncbi:hypothetical protein K4Q30_04590 [Staphylococcus epidermidis]|nr:hypothetical protein [Staphylococcus epidermidis]